VSAVVALPHGLLDSLVVGVLVFAIVLIAFVILGRTQHDHEIAGDADRSASEQAYRQMVAELLARVHSAPTALGARGHGYAQDRTTLYGGIIGNPKKNVCDEPRLKAEVGQKTLNRVPVKNHFVCDYH
jgi:hypothetical protein